MENKNIKGVMIERKGPSVLSNSRRSVSKSLAPLRSNSIRGSSLNYSGVCLQFSPSQATNKNAPKNLTVYLD